MKLFRRKSEEMPSENQNYYQTEKRGRMGIAWMLALATVITTLMLTLGLFYGGRWAYRSIFDNNENDKKGNTAVNQPMNEDNHTAEPQTSSSVPTSGTTPTQTSNTPSVATPTATPTTGPLPNTGPDIPL